MLLDEKESKIVIPGPAGVLESVVSRGDSDAPLSAKNALVILSLIHI